MLVDIEKIQQAKEKLGDQAALIIAEDLQLKDHYEFDEKNLKSQCPFHHEDTGSFIWNPKNNSYHCFGCSKNYDIVNHFMSFHELTYLGAVEKLFEETGIKHSFGERGVKRNREYRYPHHEDGNRDKVEKYLEGRGLSKATLDYLDIQSDENGNIVFHYYDENDVLSVVKYRPGRKIGKKENKFWAQQNTDTMPILYNMNRIDPTKPLIITEGELDAASVIESGFTNATSIPFGAASLGFIEKNYDWLEQFQKIIVWTDNDDPGIKTRKEICARLGVYRTYFVDLPVELTKEDGSKVAVKDANNVLVNFGKKKVIEFIENAQEVPIQGVENLADVPDFDLETAPGLYTGLVDLDKLVYKFLFGSVILVTGIKGSGKTTFLNQSIVCESLDQGYDCFLYSGELASPVLKNWIETTMCGVEHQKMKNDFVRVIEPEARKAMRDWYKDRVWIYSEEDNTAEKILEKAVALTRKRGVKVWLLDNLMTINLGIGENNKLQKQIEFIVKLVGLAKLYNVLVVLVAHPRKVMPGQELTSDDISGANELGNLAQYIVSVKKYTEKEKAGTPDNKGGFKKGCDPVDFDVMVKVLKNRYTGKTGDVNLYFSYESYRFYNIPKELHKRYKWNKDTSPLPKSTGRKKDAPDFIQDEENEEEW